MRWLFPLALLALAGCSREPSDSSGRPSADGRDPTSAQGQSEPESLEGTYVGHIVNADVNPGPMSPSLREVLGDGELRLKAEGQGFEMLHMGYTLKGTYEIEGGQLVLDVQTMEGLTREALAAVDLEANKRAGKLPATEEDLKFMQQALFVTNWRFLIGDGGLTQIANEPSVPRYRFELRPD